MREYDETTLKVAERVLRRSDEIVRKRTIRTNKIRHATYAVSGFCAGILLCFGLVNLTKMSKEPGSSHEESYSNTSTNITIDNTTSVSTTAMTETTDTTSSLSETTEAETSAETTISTDTEETDAVTEIEENTEESHDPEEQVVNEENNEVVVPEEVTPAVTEKPTVLKASLCGDVNDDGLIDIEDAVFIMNYVNYADGMSWVEFYKKSKYDPNFAEQALANADMFRPSDKREITKEDAEAIYGYLNGENQLPTNDLKD